MDRNALADRLVTYADTVVAFALVNGFAFVISLGDPEIRCSIAEVSGITFAINAVFPVVGTYALFWLRGYEARLRGNLRTKGAGEESEDSAGQPSVASDPEVEHFWSVLFRVRIGLIWLFAVVVIVGVYGATRDLTCDVAGVVG